MERIISPNKKLKTLTLRCSFSLCLLLLPQLGQAASPYPTVDCVINPSQIVNISAPVSGVIKSIYADRSQLITKGQLIAELDTSIESANVRLAQERTDMSAELAAENANLTFSQRQSERVARLRGDFLVSEQDQDEAKRSQDVTYWRIEQIKHAVEIRKLELERAQALLEQKRIYSTIDGVVAERFKSEGEYVEDQPIMRIVKLDTLHVDAVFPMEYFPRIQLGMAAWVYPETNEQQGFPATVDVIDPLGDVASGTFGVRLVLDNPDLQLPAGIKCFLQLEQQIDKLLTTSTQSSQSTASMLASDNASGKHPIEPSSTISRLTDQPWFPIHLLN